MATGETESTGTEDVTFNLVSVIYHALKGATSCSQYRDDAEEEADQPLIEFFEQAMMMNRALAERGKRLLRERVTEEIEEDVVDEASKESFPASDAPAY